MYEYARNNEDMNPKRYGSHAIEQQLAYLIIMIEERQPISLVRLFLTSSSLSIPQSHTHCRRTGGWCHFHKICIP